MKNGLVAIDNKSMTSIVATLVTNDIFSLFGKKIDYLTLSFVTPLGAENYNVFAHYLLHGSG